MLKCADIFGNDMVLQRDKHIPVWGTAEPGVRVSLSLQGQTASVTAGEDGPCKAPRLCAGELHEGALTLRFENACDGLELRAHLPNGLLADPCKLEWFAVVQKRAAAFL